MATTDHNQEVNGRRELLLRLKQQAEDIKRLTTGLDEASLAKRTIPGKWSLKELVGHLYRMQQVFEMRIVAMVTEENPAVTSYDPEKDPEFEKVVQRPGQDLAMAFQTNRALLVAQLRLLRPEEWERKGRHPEYPNYNVYLQVELMVYHEAHHIYQMMLRRVHMGEIPRA